MKILEIRELLRAPTGKIFTSEHKNYAEINRTHRELHFLSSLATQLRKLATGELGEIGKISKKNLQISWKSRFLRKSWFFKIFVPGCADLVPGLPKLRASRQGPQVVPKHGRECPGASEYSRQHPRAIPNRLEHSNRLQVAPERNIKKGIFFTENYTWETWTSESDSCVLFFCLGCVQLRLDPLLFAPPSG